MTVYAVFQRGSTVTFIRLLNCNRIYICYAKFIPQCYRNKNPLQYIFKGGVVTRGKFIAFEGIDGSGKSTQSKLLYEYMLRKGYNCVLTTEPSDTAIGQFIRSNLSDLKLDEYAIQLSFTADRANHVEKVILPALKNGVHVISDRYKYSTLAYGVLTSLPENKLNALYAANEPFQNPDLILLFDMDPRNAFLNGRKNLDSFEKKHFADKDRMAKAYLELCAADKNCVKIDGYQSVEAVHTIVVKEVLKMLRDSPE